MQLPDFNELSRRVKRRLAKNAFDREERILFYSTVANFMAAKDQIKGAIQRYVLQRIQEGLSEKDYLLYVYQDIASSMAQGEKFCKAIAPWVTNTERILIEAYENTGGQINGGLENGLKQLAEDVGKANNLRAHWLKALFKPSLLWIGMFITTIIYGNILFPSLDQMLSHKRWDMTQQATYFIAIGFAYSWKILLFVLFLSVILTIYSLPRYTGRLRPFLDKFPPWNFYKLDVAMSFTTALLCQAKANILLLNSIQNIFDQTAEPYAREKLAKILRCLKQGTTLSYALQAAGGDFPDKRLTMLISMHEGKASFATQLPLQFNDWATQQEERMKALAEKIEIFSTAVTTIYTGVVFLQVQNLSTQIQAALTSTTH